MPHVHQSRAQEPADQRRRMLETPVDKLILSLVFPTIISMLVTSVYNMADTYCLPAEQCARWLENNRFVHQGPGDGWSGYLMSQIRHTLGLLPQERDGKLAVRREAQQKPGYPWDNERTREWAHIKELMRVIRETKKRVSLSVLPSLYKDIQKIAYVQRRSISDIVGDQLMKYGEIYSEKLIEYEK